MKSIKFLPLLILGLLFSLNSFSQTWNIPVGVAGPSQAFIGTTTVHDFSIRVGNAEKAKIFSSGMNSGTFKLINGSLILGDIGNSYFNYPSNGNLFFSTLTNTNDVTSRTHRMILTSDGRLGIGSSAAPAANLEVTGNTNPYIRLYSPTGLAGLNAAVSSCNTCYSNSSETNDVVLYTNGTNAGNLLLQSNGVGKGIKFVTNYQGWQGVKMLITNEGNVGIGTTTPNAPLQFLTDTRNRKIVLYDNSNNDHQYYGFGVNPFALRYQVDGTASSHVFMAGTDANTSKELVRITGGGYLQFPTIDQRRKVVLYPSQDNDNQFCGFGMDPNVMKYQVDKAGTDHVFSSGINATSSLELMRIKGNGTVAIGTNCVPADGKLAVNGKIYATGVQVKLTDANGCFPDYVFAPEYKLRSLEAVETFVKENSHLPEVPSAKEVEENGIDLAGMDVVLLKKVEELTLYMIDMNKKMEELKKENEGLKKSINAIGKE